jgi:hypothetical protein
MLSSKYEITNVFINDDFSQIVSTILEMAEIRNLSFGFQRNLMRNGNSTKLQLAQNGG